MSDPTLTPVKKLNLSLHGADASVVAALIATGAIDDSKIAEGAAISIAKIFGLNDELSNLATGISDEEARALAAEGVLQSNIESGDAAEALARQGADETLQDNIDAEALARQGADDTLQDNIDAEALARQGADETLQDNIDAEVLARQNAVSDLSDRVDTLESTFEVQEYPSVGSFPGVGLPATLYIDKSGNEAYRFQSSVVPAVYDVTVNPGDNLASVIAAASAGASIKINAGTYTLSSSLVIDKSLKLVGAGIGQTIIKSAGTSSDPVNLISVTASNVTMKDLTIQHLKTSNTSVEAAVLVSGGGFPQTRVSGFHMDTCRVEYMEFGVSIRGEAWKIVNSQLHYSGPTNSTRRAIGVYGSKGQTFVKGNAFTDNGSTGTQRAIALTSTTGTNPNETYEDTMSIEDNTFVGGQASLGQFYNQDSFQVGATPFNLVVKNNTAQETSAFVVVYGAAANFGNVFGEVTISGNTLSGSHGGTPVGTKGAFAIDGTAAFRSSALPIHISNNTVTTTTTYRSGWNALSGTNVGYASTLGSVPTLTVDASIPASLSAPVTNVPADSTLNEYILLGNSWIAPLDAEEAARIAADAATLASAQAYADQKVADLVDSAPALLDTLNELAAALGDDPNFSTTILNAVTAEETRALAAEGVLQDNIDLKLNKAGGAVDVNGSITFSLDGPYLDGTGSIGASVLLSKTHYDNDVVYHTSQFEALKDFDHRLFFNSLSVHDNKMSQLVVDHTKFEFIVSNDGFSTNTLELKAEYSGISLFTGTDHVTPKLPTQPAHLVVKSYVDSEVSDVMDAVTTAISDFGTDIAAEETARIAGDAATLASANTYTDGLVSAEETARIAGDAATLASANSYADGLVSAEEAARIAGDAATLSSAEAYADQKIADLVDSAPALLDTLNELAAALGDDPNFSTTILNAVSAEQTRAESAEAALDGRLDTLEAKAWRQALLTSNSLGVTSLEKPAGAPAIPANGAEVQVFIDGRKVFYGSEYNVASGGGSITFAALLADQTVELLYWA